jgi:hypothetical protein
LRNKLVFISFCLILLSGCNLFKKQESQKIIARVNENFLFEDEIEKILPSELKGEDSISFVNSYIDNWAKDKLILDKAIFNLPLEEQKRYDRMVEEYKNELYKKAYMSALVSKETEVNLDTIAIFDYYEKHKDIFKINEYLLKLRYLYVKNDMNEFGKIKESFKRFNLEDQIYIDNQKLKFDKAKLNDSVWVKSIDVFKNLKLKNKAQEKGILSKKTYLEVYDSIGTYFIYVKDVLKPNSVAPVSYIRPTIEQILKNKKELKLKEDLEKQILKDAIKNNDYEKFE